MALVAFSSRLTRDVTILDAGHPIKFNADINVANGYSNGTGLFKAPVTGYYFLSYTVAHKNTKDALTVGQLVNGHRISSAVVEEVDHDTVSQSGNQVITHLTAGDTVQVAIEDPGATLLVGGTEGFTSFCGYKIN